MAQYAGYSTEQIEEALRLVAISDKWAEGERPRDGLRFNLFASRTEPGVVHKTHIEGKGCDCKGAQRSKRGRCFHQLACQIVTEQAREAATRPRVTLDELMDNQLVSAF